MNKKPPGQSEGSKSAYLLAALVGVCLTKHHRRRRADSRMALYGDGDDEHKPEFSTWREV